MQNISTYKVTVVNAQRDRFKDDMRAIAATTAQLSRRRKTTDHLVHCYINDTDVVETALDELQKAGVVVSYERVKLAFAGESS